MQRLGSLNVLIASWRIVFCLIFFWLLVFLPMGPWPAGQGLAHGDAATPVAGGRFFHGGNGWIHLKGEKSGIEFKGRYRNATGDYDDDAYQELCRVFGAPCDTRGTISLRLIEFLDALEDHFRPGALITITSGYRAPRYNRKLREKGRLAAKASLHQYGMAADLVMAGVSSRHIWEHVKALGFGGAGYYHGRTVHIDVGPARSWDEKSSGVGTGISDDNKLIGLVTDFDMFSAGDPMVLRFIRMTAFPVGVRSEFTLYRQGPQGDRAVTDFAPAVSVTGTGPCRQFGDINEMDGIRWRLPGDLESGRYRIVARFCGSMPPAMPGEAATPVFQVVDAQ